MCISALQYNAVQSHRKGFVCCINLYFFHFSFLQIFSISSGSMISCKPFFISSKISSSGYPLALEMSLSSTTLFTALSSDITASLINPSTSSSSFNSSHFPLCPFFASLYTPLVRPASYSYVSHSIISIKRSLNVRSFRKFPPLRNSL